MASSPVHIKYVAVFCASTLGNGTGFAKAAEHLGEVLAKEKLHLVYGGGSMGLMGCVSEAARAGGSQVIGVMSAPLKHLLGETKGQELVVPGMMERKIEMLSQSDAFIAMPGGIGTLDEIFHVATWNLLNIHQKPIGFLNVNHFYDSLLSFFDRTMELGFISPPARRLLMSADTAEELIEKLRAYKHEPHPNALSVNWSAGSSRKRPLDLSLHL